MSRHQVLPPIEERGMYYGKIIRVMRNGDKKYEGKKILINEHDVKSFEKLLDSLNEKMKPITAIRRLYTPDNGTRITRMDEIEEDKLYVAAANDRFKRVG
ncbi:hypothetical protein FSP39_003372 [Pinctada imbricata]|uniref:Doublecortin domain-containing protein n=1 Tax=Pinctada imbricata TaxID=66713 RepID=A0AA88XTJ2_PINIB|nr:hypothetical protein FSP39_003372 [Pinctada imbricata]